MGRKDTLGQMWRPTGTFREDMMNLTIYGSVITY